MHANHHRGTITEEREKSMLLKHITSFDTQFLNMGIVEAVFISDTKEIIN